MASHQKDICVFWTIAWRLCSSYWIGKNLEIMKWCRRFKMKGLMFLGEKSTEELSLLPLTALNGLSLWKLFWVCCPLWWKSRKETENWYFTIRIELLQLQSLGGGEKRDTCGLREKSFKSAVIVKETIGSQGKVYWHCHGAQYGYLPEIAGTLFVFNK